MFHPDGAPARVTLSVSFKEYRTLRQLIEKPRRESADKTKRRVVVGSDTLWAIAAREYDDVSEWVWIAEANDLDDPRQIRPGDWLELPPMENKWNWSTFKDCGNFCAGLQCARVRADVVRTCSWR